VALTGSGNDGLDANRLTTKVAGVPDARRRRNIPRAPEMLALRLSRASVAPAGARPVYSSKTTIEWTSPWTGRRRETDVTPILRGLRRGVKAAALLGAGLGWAEERAAKTAAVGAAWAVSFTLLGVAAGAGARAALKRYAYRGEGAAALATFAPAAWCLTRSAKKRN
jgi:hypothetical protein